MHYLDEKAKQMEGQGLTDVALSRFQALRRKNSLN